MKSYKDFDVEYIGSSDIAALVLCGYKKGKGAIARMLDFGIDENYMAYIVDTKEVEIGKHYTLIDTFNSWLKIYDDTERTATFKADIIKIYRAGDMGCIIQLINE